MDEKIDLLRQVIKNAPKEFEVTLTVGTLREFIKEEFSYK